MTIFAPVNVLLLWTSSPALNNFCTVSHFTESLGLINVWLHFGMLMPFDWQSVTSSISKVGGKTEGLHQFQSSFSGSKKHMHTIPSSGSNFERNPLTIQGPFTLVPIFYHKNLTITLSSGVLQEKPNKIYSLYAARKPPVHSHKKTIHVYACHKNISAIHCTKTVQMQCHKRCHSMLLQDR